MGKKRGTGEYNDFLDGEKLRDNASVRTTLHGPSSLDWDVSPAAPRRDKKGRGRKGKGEPKKPQLTHFLCLPLVNERSRPQLEKCLDMLKGELAKEGLVPLKAVRPVGTLHLTLGVMSLDSHKLEAAKQRLQEFDLRDLLRDITIRQIGEKAAEGGEISESFNAAALSDIDALSIDLKGLVPMQAPQKTSILYAEPVARMGRLYSFGKVLREVFTESGLMVEDKRELKLHATIVNTIYAKPGGRRGKGRSGAQKSKAAGEIEDSIATQDFVEQHDDAASTGVSLPDSEPQELTSTPLDPSIAETEATVPEEHVDRSEGHGPNAKSWMWFDARGLIEKYEEVVWAEGVRIDRVQICKMGAKKVLDANGEVLGEEYEVVYERSISSRSHGDCCR